MLCLMDNILRFISLLAVCAAMIWFLIVLSSTQPEEIKSTNGLLVSILFILLGIYLVLASR